MSAAAADIFDQLSHPEGSAGELASQIDRLKDATSFVDEKGRTLLHQAAAGGNLLAVQRLLARNCAPSRRWFFAGLRRITRQLRLSGASHRQRQSRA